MGHPFCCLYGFGRYFATKSRKCWMNLKQTGRVGWFDKFGKEELSELLVE